MRQVGCFLALLGGLALSTCGNPSAISAAEKHPFSIDDYSALRGARAVAVAPDGETILYRVSFDGTSGPADKHVWHLIEASGENARKLTLPENFEPSGFTKEGSALYGAYPVGKLTQLAIVPFNETKPTQIVTLPSGIRSAIISPDGARFAVLADPRKKDPLADVRTVVENDETSLYVIGLDGEGSWWCPTLKDITDIAWSPDGSHIAVITQWPKMGHHELHSFVDVCSPAGARRLAEIPNGTSGVARAKRGQENVFASTSS